MEDFRSLRLLPFVANRQGAARSYGYWMASWREMDRVRNVHLGSCAKMDRELAMQKARKMKAEALGVKP